jgi:hypothetical protein
MESLEDRTTPATFTVTNTNLSGVGSLPWAVAQANNDRSYSSVAINFSSAMNGSTIRLQQTLELNNPTGESITITAPPGVITISGGGAFSNFSVFKIDAGTNVTMQGQLYIENGHSDLGGGINNQGSLTMYQCGLMYDSATEGGAIYNAGSLQLTYTYMASNTASYGGCVSNHGSMGATQSAFWTSNASQAGGGIYNTGFAELVGGDIESNYGTSGGGIYNSGSGTTYVMSNSTIYNNTAGTTGGGIANYGTLYASNSSITSNKAATGGGIYNWGGGGIYSCTIASNTAFQNSSFRSGFGGGIFNNGSLTLQYSQVTGNLAAVAGGGIAQFGSSGSYLNVSTPVSGNTAPIGANFDQGVYML